MAPREDDPFAHVQREVERLWRDLVYHQHPSTHLADQAWAPPADVVVTQDSARVILELAGVPRDAVRVRLQGRTLIVSGRRVPPQELQGAHYHRAEIYFGSFERWRTEFVAMGKAMGGGSGWVLLIYAPRDGKLVNQWAADHTHGLAGSSPILALDMYEHSYHIDYGAAAAKYLDAFMDNVRWENVARLHQKHAR